MNYLQSFLAKAEHEKVDKISRAPMEQDDVCLVDPLVGCDVASWVPLQIIYVLIA